MPPKRKRDDNATAIEDAAPAATRRSTRQTAAKKKVVETESESEPEPEPAPKKPKKSTTAKAATKSKKVVVEQGEDEQDVEPAPPKKTKGRAKAAPKATKASSKKKSCPLALDHFLDVLPEALTDNATEPSLSQPKSAVKPAPVKSESYSVDNAENLFSTYADSDDPTVIGPEGFERLCTDAKLDMEGAQPMILSWQMEAKEMLKLPREGWMKWTAQTKVSSLPALRAAVVDLEGLLIRDGPVQDSSSDKYPYDRAHYLSSAHHPEAEFTKLYMYCFNLAKPAESRNLEMDTVVAFWGVLLSPKYPIMSELLEYIAENTSTYKGSNKDLWSMMLEFCRTVSADLDDFEEDGAWPTLLDGFVAWKKERMMST